MGYGEWRVGNGVLSEERKNQDGACHSPLEICEQLRQETPRRPIAAQPPMVIAHAADGLGDTRDYALRSRSYLTTYLSCSIRP